MRDELILLALWILFIIAAATATDGNAAPVVQDIVVQQSIPLQQNIAQEPPVRNEECTTKVKEYAVDSDDDFTVGTSVHINLICSESISVITLDVDNLPEAW